MTPKLVDATYDELIRLGFSEYRAAILAQIPGLRAADVRETLIKKGCSLDMAWQILEP